MRASPAAPGPAVTLSREAPPGWAERAPLPCQSAGFAAAMRTLGYAPRFVSVDGRGVLALVRGAVPALGRLTARANVFAPPDDARVVAAALGALRCAGIPFAKVGDTMWGLRWQSLPEDWPFPRTRVVTRHTFALDLSLDVESLLRRQETAVRTSLRRAEREGVRTREVTTPAELRAYCDLAGQTTTRVRSQTTYTDYPGAFFEAVHARMVPSGAARMYVAWHHDTPLAGCIVLCGAGSGLYFAGASTRDRALTALQGPSAVLWHAIRDLKERGFRRFDLGGCTPTDDAADPRHGVYAFKRRWGGELETFSTLEVVLGPWGHALQARVLAPLWDRLHPLYFRLRALVGRDRATGAV